MEALEKASQTFHEHLGELLKDEGKFALVHNGQVIDLFTSYEDALKVGYQRFGMQPFLVKQIQAVEQAHFVSREIL